MPETATMYGKMFSSVVGQSDNVLWGKLWVAMYADAYFETDVRTCLANVASTLPAGSFPKYLYDKCVALHTTNSTDWRWAVGQILLEQKPIYKISMLNLKDRDPDMCNAFGLLAILYGNNDYTQTITISALAGYDGDCTSAGIGGLMGIIKGTAGTPSQVMTSIYASGNGVYVAAPSFDPPAAYFVVDLFECKPPSLLRKWPPMRTSKRLSLDSRPCS
jgi:hypothetical protein